MTFLKNNIKIIQNLYFIYVFGGGGLFSFSIFIIYDKMFIEELCIFLINYLMFFMQRRNIMQILLVEDELSLSRAIKRILEKHGYVVDAVYDGESAVDYACGASYNLIILDVMLPRLNGFDVIKVQAIATLGLARKVCCKLFIDGRFGKFFACLPVK